MFGTKRRAGVALLVTSVFVLSLFLTACGQPVDEGETTQEPGESESPKKELVFAMGAEAVTLDPQDATDNPSEMVNRHIYDNLVAFTEDMDKVPQLASDWEVSSDGLTWTFYLQEGVKFHDGTDFNAEAVKSNFERLMDESNNLARSSLYSPYIDSIEVIDDYTAVFHMKLPFGAFLAHLAHGAGAVISPAAVEKYGDELNRNPVGTGPFIFDEWVPGDHIRIVKNEDYWGTKAKLDSVVFKPVSEGASRTMMIESGDVDVAYPLPSTDVERLQGSDDLQVLIRPSQRVIYIGMNCQTAPLDDVRVRQAINYAIDKQAIVDNIMQGLAQVADSPVAPTTSGYVKQEPYAYDPDRARELLQEAGVAEGTTIKLWTPEGRYLMDRQTAEAVQGYLQEVGFNVEFQKWEWGAYLDEVNVNNVPPTWELFLLGWAPSTGDADWVVRPLFQSGHSSNRALLADPEVDEWIEAQMTAPTEAERMEALDNAQRLIMEKAPWAFLHVMDQTIAAKESVTGITILPIEIVMFREADITE